MAVPMRRRERAQSVVELALLLPVLLVLVGLAFDVGQAMGTYSTLVHAAREGAWVASERPWDRPAIESAVRTALRDGGLDPARATITVSTGAPGRPVAVTVTYPYTPLFPLPGDLRLQVTHTMVRLY